MREALASALYVALVLIASIIVLPESHLPSDRAMVELLLGAAVGLTATHWLAFRLATRLTDETGAWTGEAAREGLAQLVGGLAVAMAASLPFVLLDGRAAVVTALVVLATVPTAAGIMIARKQGRSWFNTLLYAVVVLAIAAAAVGLKASLGSH